MIRTKHLLLLFIPATLLAIFGLFVQWVRYLPPKVQNATESKERTLAQIPILVNDPIIGKKTAPITIIAFEDLLCLACQKEISTLISLVDIYPKKVKIIWKGLPVTRLPFPSELAHTYALCANEQQKFLPFIQEIFGRIDPPTEEILQSIASDVDLDTTRLTSCLQSGRGDDYRTKTEEIAKTLAIQSVPALFLNNKHIESPKTIDGWKALLLLN